MRNENSVTIFAHNLYCRVTFFFVLSSFRKGKKNIRHVRLILGCAIIFFCTQNDIFISRKKDNFLSRKFQKESLTRFKAPAKRSQHVNVTYRNIVGRNIGR